MMRRGIRSGGGGPVRAALALAGGVAGAWLGFALVFYGYLLVRPPGPSGVEFEAASAAATLWGAPFGALAGLALGGRALGGRVP